MRILILFTFLLLYSTAKSQNEDSLYAVTYPMFDGPYDTLMVDYMLTHQLDSFAIVSDTIIGNDTLSVHIRYLGSFYTNSAARYKLVDYVIYSSDGWYDSHFRKILAFDGKNDLIGYYELHNGSLIIELSKDGIITIKPHPENYDCNRDIYSVIDLKSTFPANLYYTCAIQDEQNPTPSIIHFVPSK